MDFSARVKPFDGRSGSIFPVVLLRVAREIPPRVLRGASDGSHRMLIYQITSRGHLKFPPDRSINNLQGRASRFYLHICTEYSLCSMCNVYVSSIRRDTTSDSFQKSATEKVCGWEETFCGHCWSRACVVSLFFRPPIQLAFTPTSRAICAQQRPQCTSTSTPLGPHSA